MIDIKGDSAVSLHSLEQHDKRIRFQYLPWLSVLCCPYSVTGPYSEVAPGAKFSECKKRCAMPVVIGEVRLFLWKSRVRCNVLRYTYRDSTVMGTSCPVMSI